MWDRMLRKLVTSMPVLDKWVPCKDVTPAGVSSRAQTRCWALLTPTPRGLMSWQSGARTIVRHKWKNTLYVMVTDRGLDGWRMFSASADALDEHEKEALQNLRASPEFDELRHASSRASAESKSRAAGSIAAAAKRAEQDAWVAERAKLDALRVVLEGAAAQCAPPRGVWVIGVFESVVRAELAVDGAAQFVLQFDATGTLLEVFALGLSEDVQVEPVRVVRNAQDAVAIVGRWNDAQVCTGRCDDSLQGALQDLCRQHALDAAASHPVPRGSVLRCIVRSSKHPDSSGGAGSEKAVAYAVELDAAQRHCARAGTCVRVLHGRSRRASERCTQCTQLLKRLSERAVVLQGGSEAAMCKFAKTGKTASVPPTLLRDVIRLQNIDAKRASAKAAEREAEIERLSAALQEQPRAPVESVEQSELLFKALDYLEEHDSLVQSVTKSLLRDQIKLSQLLAAAGDDPDAKLRARKGMRWSPDVIKWLLLMGMQRGIHSVDAVRDLFVLPSTRLLRSYRNAGREDAYGCLVDRFEEKYNMYKEVGSDKSGPNARKVVVCFDGMHLQAGIIHDVFCERFIGVEELRLEREYERILEAKDKKAVQSGKSKPATDKVKGGDVATQMIMFHAIDLQTGVKAAVATFYTSLVNQHTVWGKLDEVLEALSAYRFDTVAVVLDGDSAHRKLEARALRKWKHGDAVASVLTRGADRRPIFVISDPSHLIKKLRNSIWASRLVHAPKPARSAASADMDVSDADVDDGDEPLDAHEDNGEQAEHDSDADEPADGAVGAASRAAGQARRAGGAAEGAAAATAAAAAAAGEFRPCRLRAVGKSHSGRRYMTMGGQAIVWDTMHDVKVLANDLSRLTGFGGNLTHVTDELLLLNSFSKMRVDLAAHTCETKVTKFMKSDEHLRQHTALISLLENMHKFFAAFNMAQLACPAAAVAPQLNAESAGPLQQVAPGSASDSASPRASAEEAAATVAAAVSADVQSVLDFFVAWEAEKEDAISAATEALQHATALERQAFAEGKRRHPEISGKNSRAAVAQKLSNMIQNAQARSMSAATAGGAAAADHVRMHQAELAQLQPALQRLCEETCTPEERLSALWPAYKLLWLAKCNAARWVKGATSGRSKGMITPECLFDLKLACTGFLGLMDFCGSTRLAIKPKMLTSDYCENWFGNLRGATGGCNSRNPTAQECMRYTHVRTSAHRHGGATFVPPPPQLGTASARKRNRPFERHLKLTEGRIERQIPLSERCKDTEEELPRKRV